MASVQSKFSSRSGLTMWYVVVSYKDEVTRKHKQKWICISDNELEARRAAMDHETGRYNLLELYNHQPVQVSPASGSSNHGYSKNNNSGTKKAYLSLFDCIERFNIWVEVNKHIKTFNKYSMALRDFTNFLCKDKNIYILTVDDLEKYKADMKARKLSPATISDYIAIVGRLYKYLINVKKYNLYNIINDVEKPKKTRDKQPHFLTMEQVDFLFELVEEEGRNEFYKKRDKLIIAILYYTGLRRQELCNIKWTDINYKANLLSVKEGKGNRDSVVPIAKDLLKMLNDYPCPYKNHTHVITDTDGKKLSGSAIRLFFKRRKKLFNEKYPDAKLHPHVLRHTFGSHLAMNGVNQRKIQSLMRHRSPISTQIYTHLTEESYQNEVNLLGNNTDK